MSRTAGVLSSQNGNVTSFRVYQSYLLAFTNSRT